MELDEARYEPRRAGAPIRLDPKAFRVLTYLIQHHDRVVTRDELLDRFWPGVFVTGASLAHCIVKARQALDDGIIAHPVIKTVHGHGYHFIRAVVTRSPEAAINAIPLAPQPPIAVEVPPISDTAEPLAHQHLTSQRLPEGERKQATVLSMGVKGIPALAQVLDLEVLPAVLRQFFDLMRIEVQRIEG